MDKFEFINVCVDNGISVSKGVLEDALRDCGLPITESKPQTNADRIRAMSDGELRNLLCNNTECGSCRWGEPQGCTLTEWLKQTAEVNDYERQ